MMQKQKIVLVGAGGHCKSVIDVIEEEEKFQIAGIIDLPHRVGKDILGYPIIGTDDDIPNLVKEYKTFHITIGQIESTALRTRILKILKENNAIMPVVISPFAYVAKSSKIKEGTIIMHHALVNAEATIGKNCIVNSKALIEHEVSVGDHCHISTNAVINGQVAIGNSVFIGSNTTVYNNRTITDNVVIGGGSCITHDIKEAGIYIGNPIKKIR